MTEALSRINTLYVLALAIAAALLYWTIFYFLAMSHEGGVVSAGFLIFAPVAAPALAVLLVDPRGQMKNGEHLKLGIVVICALIIASFFVLSEGGICVIMVAPLYLLFGTAGAVLMGALLRRRRMRLLSSVLVLLPLLATPVEKAGSHPARHEMVTSVAEIAAPPQIVWANTVAVANINPSELGWTFTQSIIGVPMPSNAVMQGHGVGAVRHVTWDRGIHFDERITRWEENKVLTWNFHFGKDAIPKDIERHMSPDSDYLKVQAGGYELEPLPNGHTRLTLHTRYWERTALNDYCAWWGRIFIGDFHRNVLHVIRLRSERSV